MAADGEEVVLTDMLVRDAGYAMNLDDLSRVMYPDPDVLDRVTQRDGQLHDETPKLFGRFNAGELIEALESAEIIGQAPPNA